MLRMLRCDCLRKIWHLICEANAKRRESHGKSHVCDAGRFGKCEAVCFAYCTPECSAGYLLEFECHFVAFVDGAEAIVDGRRERKELESAIVC